MYRPWGLPSETVPALKVFFGDRHVNEDFQHDLASNKAESCTGKFGSPELELDQREDLVQKMTGLGQKVGCTNL